jgi:HemY protein
MRAILWILLLFTLAVAITLLAQFDAGYVVVVLPPWRLEMSFMLAAVAILIVFAIVYFVLRVARLALRLPTDVRAWHRRRRADKAEDELSRAIAAYLSGQTAHALKLADKALKKQYLPLAALVAAHAAVAEGQGQIVEFYLKDLKTEIGELNAARQAVEAKLAEAATPSSSASSVETAQSI